MPRSTVVLGEAVTGPDPDPFSGAGGHGPGGEQPVVTMTVLEMPADEPRTVPGAGVHRLAAVLAVVAAAGAIAGSFLPLIGFGPPAGEDGGPGFEVVTTAWGTQMAGKSVPGAGALPLWGPVLLAVGVLLLVSAAGLLVGRRRAGMAGSLFLAATGALVAVAVVLGGGIVEGISELRPGNGTWNVGSGLWLLGAAGVVAICGSAVCAWRAHCAERALTTLRDAQDDN